MGGGVVAVCGHVGYFITRATAVNQGVAAAQGWATAGFAGVVNKLWGSHSPLYHKGM